MGQIIRSTQLKMWANEAIKNNINKPKGVDKKTWETSPKYVRQRENAEEFAKITRAGSYLYLAMGEGIDNIASTKNSFGKIVERMGIVKNADTVNKRGKRTITSAGLLALSGFEFNAKVATKKLIGGIYKVVANGDGAIWTYGNVGELRMNYPSGTTHVKVTMGLVHLDMVGFENEEFSDITKNEQIIPLEDWKTALDGQTFDNS